MSREYMVLFAKPDENGSIDGMEAEVFMRFTEEPSTDFLGRLAKERPGTRVYCLLGASAWHETEPEA